MVPHPLRVFYSEIGESVFLDSEARPPLGAYSVLPREKRSVEQSVQPYSDLRRMAMQLEGFGSPGHGEQSSRSTKRERRLPQSKAMQRREIAGGAYIVFHLCARQQTALNCSPVPQRPAGVLMAQGWSLCPAPP